jgi:hypothetical protein
MGEMGLAGIVTFGGLVIVLAVHLRRLARMSKPVDGPTPDASLHALARAMQASLFLLLFLGLFGHNLYRYNWAWYCAFTAVALGVCQERLRDSADIPEMSTEETHGWDYSISPAAV